MIKAITATAAILAAIGLLHVATAPVKAPSNPAPIKEVPVIQLPEMTIGLPAPTSPVDASSKVKATKPHAHARKALSKSPEGSTGQVSLHALTQGGRSGHRFVIITN